MYFTFCGMDLERMEVLMSFAVSSVVWREPMADEAAGIAEGRSGEGLILKIYVPCKKTKPGFTILIYLFSCQWGGLPSIDFKQRSFAPAKARGQARSINSFIVPPSKSFAESQLGLKRIGDVSYHFSETSGGVTTISLFPETTTENLTTPSSVSPTTSETNTFDRGKAGSERQKPGGSEVELPWNPREDELHCAHALTLTRPDKPMTKSSRVAASQNLAWRPSRPPTPPPPVPAVHDCRATETPCHRDDA